MKLSHFLIVALLCLTACAPLPTSMPTSERLGAVPVQSGVKPLLTDNEAILAGSDTLLRVYDRHTQALRWSAPLSNEVLPPVALAEDRLFVATRDGLLTAFAKSDGRVLWQWQLPSFSVSSHTLSGPIVVDSTVFAVFGDGVCRYFSAQTGQLLGQIAPDWGRSSLRFVREDAVSLKVLAVQNRRQVLLWQSPGTLKLLASNGDLKWQRDGFVQGDWQICHRQLVVLEKNQHLWLLSLNTGDTIWQQPLPFTVKPGVSPACGQASLTLVDTTGMAHGVALATGRDLGQQPWYPPEDITEG